MSETSLRLSLFFLALLILALWEYFAPRRIETLPRAKRWPANLGVSVMNSLVLRLFLPFTALSTALFAQTNEWGLFNQNLFKESFFTPFLAFILLDLAIYGQHIFFHKLPWLWRIHRMHHADTQMDVTTGLRFHPLESLISMLLKCSAILLLGAPPSSVVAFEIMLNLGSMFSHSNISPPFEKILRYVIVTPAMHEVHHSPLKSETDSNYGFNLSLWDRLFRTYSSVSSQHLIGLESFREQSEARLDKMLIQPFK
jgi:sterol desaturase/sphingolipid hydroxylase (fatty acid hydroxylase superfamily)